MFFDPASILSSSFRFLMASWSSDESPIWLKYFNVLNDSAVYSQVECSWEPTIRQFSCNHPCGEYITLGRGSNSRIEQLVFVSGSIPVVLLVFCGYKWSRTEQDLRIRCFPQEKAGWCVRWWSSHTARFPTHGSTRTNSSRVFWPVFVCWPESYAALLSIVSPTKALRVNLFVKLK